MIKVTYSSRFLLSLSMLCVIAWGGSARANFEIENWTTDNGVQVYHVYQSELPMVDIELIFDAGSARDGKLYGLASLVAELLAYGAGGMDADQISTAFDSIGAEYYAETARDTTSIRLRTLTEQLQRSTELLATVVSAPDFDEQMLEQTKTRTLTAIRKQAQDPGAIASIALYQALYGDHPYGHPRIGCGRNGLGNYTRRCSGLLSKILCGTQYANIYRRRHQSEASKTTRRRTEPKVFSRL